MYYNYQTLIIISAAQNSLQWMRDKYSNFEWYFDERAELDLPEVESFTVNTDSHLGIRFVGKNTVCLCKINISVSVLELLLTHSRFPVVMLMSRAQGAVVTLISTLLGFTFTAKKYIQN